MGNTLITSAHIDVSADDGRKRVGLGFGASRTEDRRALWEEMLVAAVFHERSAARGLPRVVWVSSPQIRPGEHIVDRAPRGSVRWFTRAEAQPLAQRVRHAVAGSGAHLDELVLLQPHGLAPLIRLRVNDPVRFMRERYQNLLAALDDDRIRYEGEFLEIVDGSGRPVWQTFGVTRIHWGHHWYLTRLFH